MERHECGKTAVFTFIWPGRNARHRICAGHASWLFTVANALSLNMGCLDLQVCEFPHEGCEQKIPGFEKDPVNSLPLTHGK